VVDLQIAPCEVTATVSGSRLYTVEIKIADVPPPQWGSICADCAGGIDSVVELLQGRFAKGVMERICRQGDGLFPTPAEIRFSCTCPDRASMCKHVAAVLYGVGARLDVQPELLFHLRAVDERDLIAQIDSALPLATTASSSGKLLETDDLSALFGLELAGSDIPPELAGNLKRATEIGVAATKPARPKRHPAVPEKKGKRRRETAA
jgi:uncharacterized Zn finger protein